MDFDGQSSRKEQRRFRRFPVNILGAVSTDSQDSCPCRILDISWGGLQVRLTPTSDAIDELPIVLAPGQTVELSIVANGASGAARLRARVQRAAVARFPNRFGLNIVQADQNLYGMLRTLTRRYRDEPALRESS